MFTRNRIIFALTTTTLHVTRVDHVGHEVLETADFEIGDAGLAGVFEQARKQFGQGARLIVPEEYVYVTRLEVEKLPSLTRSNIEKKIEDIFPEVLGDMAWDYQTIASTETGMMIELSGMTSDFTQVLKEALHQAKYRLEAVIPESYALAHQLIGKEVTLLIHERADGWIVALVKDQLVATALFQTSIPTMSDVQNVIDFSKERKKLVPEQGVYSLVKTLPEELPKIDLPQVTLDKPLDAVLGAAKMVLGQTDGQRLDLPLRDTKRSWWRRWL